MFSCKYWKTSKKPILKNIWVRLLLKRLQEVINQDFLSGESLSKSSSLSNITKIAVAFKPEPSLNLTPTLYFGLRFPMFNINGYDRKANACSIWTSCCVCVKRITFCNCLCSSSSSSCFSAKVIRNIEEFGAKNYFTDHRTANTIQSFRDSFLVFKICDCQNRQKGHAKN